MLSLHTKVRIKAYGITGTISERHDTVPEPTYRVCLDEILFLPSMTTKTLSCLESELEPADLEKGNN